MKYTFITNGILSHSNVSILYMRYNICIIKLYIYT